MNRQLLRLLSKYILGIYEVIANYNIKLSNILYHWQLSMASFLFLNHVHYTSHRSGQQECDFSIVGGGPASWEQQHTNSTLIWVQMMWNPGSVAQALQGQQKGTPRSWYSKFGGHMAGSRNLWLMAENVTFFYSGSENTSIHSETCQKGDSPGGGGDLPHPIEKSPIRLRLKLNFAPVQ